mmetsp:Transcript_25974/g.84082  ORF Transcript_25974/g.84082 Transcript_25974/m.84082 type:complete len:276 (+) Transcript_25974:327-1154(+)
MSPGGEVVGDVDGSLLFRALAARGARADDAVVDGDDRRGAREVGDEDPLARDEEGRLVLVEAVHGGGDGVGIRGGERIVDVASLGVVELDFVLPGEGLDPLGKPVDEGAAEGVEVGLLPEVDDVVAGRQRPRGVLAVDEGLRVVQVLVPVEDDDAAALQPAVARGDPFLRVEGAEFRPEALLEVGSQPRETLQLGSKHGVLVGLTDGRPDAFLPRGSTLTAPAPRNGAVAKLARPVGVVPHIMPADTSHQVLTLATMRSCWRCAAPPPRRGRLRG